MSHFGNIKSYDAGKGRGTIAPEKGGEPLGFVKADLQKEASAPEQGQRYGYETRQTGGDKPQAFNLRRQEQGKAEQPQQAASQQA